MSPSRDNVVLVGVAGVGKTTLGELAAAQLGMAFVDIDQALEAAENADIDTLIARHGDDGFDDRLLLIFQRTVSKCSNTLIAAPARLADSRGFWEVTRAYAISIHLRGNPDDVYSRQAVYVKGRRLTDEEKEEEPMIAGFKEYHRWRVRHCGKADHTVRIAGDKAKDAITLCRMIECVRASTAGNGQPGRPPEAGGESHPIA